MGNNDFRFEITRHYGVISKSKIGWALELNIVSWNSGTPKYDLRWWDSDHERMSRGVTLSKAEMQKLLLTLIDMSLVDAPVIIERAMSREEEK